MSLSVCSLSSGSSPPVSPGSSQSVCFRPPSGRLCPGLSPANFPVFRCLAGSGRTGCGQLLVATSPGGTPPISPLTTFLAIFRPVKISFPTTLRTGRVSALVALELASCSVKYRAAAGRYSTTVAAHHCGFGRLDFLPLSEGRAKDVKDIKRL